MSPFALDTKKVIYMKPTRKRLERVTEGISIHVLSRKSGICVSKLSLAERNLANLTPDEERRRREAIREIREEGSRSA